MHPVDEKTLEQGVQQPLVFINSDLDFQVPDSIRKMVKATKPANRQGWSIFQYVAVEPLLKDTSSKGSQNVYLQ